MARLNLRQVAQAAIDDPKKALLDSLGDISGLEIAHNQVMVATYIEPEITPGGIIKPDVALMENRFQGKVGLVVKVGPTAFVDNAILGVEFGSFAVKEGDWVFYRASDGFEMYSVKKGHEGTSCRLLSDTQIKGRVSDPALVW